MQVWKSRIIRLDSGGKLDTGWQMIVDGFIHSMITDKEGRLYIADSDCLITRYTPDGGKDSGFGSGGILEDGHITAMAADRNGYLYACVGEFNRVTRYTPEGTPDTVWGNGGDIIIPDIDEGGESYGISSIAVDDFCNLYVSDTTNNRILRYDSSGKPDTSWCDNGEWRSADTMSDAPAPMQYPARVIVFKGDLYAVWNYKLYKMRDTLAQAGSKTGAGPQASANVSPENARETVVILNGHDKYVNWWWWAIGAGALILCAGAVFWVLKRRGK